MHYFSKNKQIIFIHRKKILPISFCKACKQRKSKLQVSAENKFLQLNFCSNNPKDFKKYIRIERPAAKKIKTRALLSFPDFWLENKGRCSFKAVSCQQFHYCNHHKKTTKLKENAPLSPKVNCSCLLGT